MSNIMWEDLFFFLLATFMRSTMLPLLDYNALFCQYSRQCSECDGQHVAGPQLRLFEIPLVSLVFPSFPTHLSRIKFLCLFGQFFFLLVNVHHFFSLSVSLNIQKTFSFFN